jgi:lysophospholipase L1-like esterase
MPVRIGASIAAMGLLAAAAMGARALFSYRADLLARLDLGQTGPPPAAANPGPSADPAHSAVLFAGDSRIASWPTPPSLSGVHIINLGRYGETTAQLLARLDSDIVDREPRLVVLQTGINDLKAMGVFRTLSEEIAENCWLNLRRIIDRLRSRDIPVVVLTIFPVGDVRPLRYPIWSNDTLTAIAEINERLLTLDEPGVHVVDCDPILAKAGRMRGDYVVDDFHINEAAYQALSERITPLLDEALRNLGDGRAP